MLFRAINDVDSCYGSQTLYFVDYRAKDIKWFSVINLKYAFSCIPIDEQTQLLFALKWQDQKLKPYSNTVGLWSQGFKNFLTIFGEIVAKDLRIFHWNWELKTAKHYHCCEAFVKERI